MTEQMTWTIKRLLDWTADFFQTKQLQAPRLSAEILLAEALACQRIDLYTRFDSVPPETGLAKFRDWVKRHARGEPVAYLVGQKEFYSLRFQVSSDVLIPRPETEHLVLAALDAAKVLGHPTPTIIDVGTGCGCVAVAIAKHLPASRVVATDISAPALEVARANINDHQLSSQITVFHCDLLEGIPATVQPHLIVSNPPYIGTSEQETVDPSVRDYEPHVALFAGDYGTDLIVRLIQQAGQRLIIGGYLIFETSPIVFDRCLQLVKDAGNFSEPHTIKDYSGHRRIIQTCKYA